MEKQNQLSDRLSSELENTVLTTGKEIRRIVHNDCAIYSLYLCNDQSVVKKNKPMFAIIAHEDAYRAFGAKKENGGLLLIGWDINKIVRELAELVVSYEDQIKGKAA
jgi:hypothetical protein